MSDGCKTSGVNWPLPATMHSALSPVLNLTKHIGGFTNASEARLIGTTANLCGGKQPNKGDVLTQRLGGPRCGK